MGRTYNVLVFLGVVSNLGDDDGAIGLHAISVLAYPMSTVCCLTVCRPGNTGVFELDLDIKDGDDLALALGDIAVALDAQDLGDLGRDAVLFSADDGEILREVVLCPVAGILVHPVPCH